MQAIGYPREALKDSIEGEVVIEFTVTGIRAGQGHHHQVVHEPRV